MSTVAIVYRDNDIYANYLPVIIESLQAGGHEIVTNVYPQGTPEGKMSITDLPSADYVLVDKTFCRATGYEVKTLDPGGVLDELFKVATRAGLGPKKKGSLQSVVSEALANGASVPEEVVVVEECMDHHRVVPDVTDDKQAATTVALWFRDLFPNARVRVVEKIEEANAPCETPRRWLVADRHAVSHATRELEHRLASRNGLFFRLPLESAVSDLHELGLISVDENAFKEFLCEHPLTEVNYHAS